VPVRSARPRVSATTCVPNDAATELADRLHSATIHLLRRLRREDARTGLSGPRLSALSVVVFAGPLTLGELAAAEQVRPPTMTRLVRALEVQGLVTREPDEHDGRVVRLRATAEGRTLMAEGRARRVRALAEGLRTLDVTDMTALHKAVATLERVVKQLGNTSRVGLRREGPANE
jgi:DNA-binding MarR family transcriptional regulator